jgi:hypothetical protein
MQEDKHLPLSNDMDKALAGILALGQYLGTPDDVRASIAVLSAKSGAVRSGEPSKYEIKLVNNTRQHCWLNLIVDIYLKENPIHPEGHHAYFAKAVFVASRAIQNVVFIYDWQEKAAFAIDGVLIPVDDAWFGPCKAQKTYLVRAILRSMEGNQFEDLLLVQHLVP